MENMLELFKLRKKKSITKGKEKKSFFSYCSFHYASIFAFPDGMNNDSRTKSIAKELVTYYSLLTYIHENIFLPRFFTANEKKSASVKPTR
jgi:hypothetical protein